MLLMYACLAKISPIRDGVWSKEIFRYIKNKIRFFFFFSENWEGIWAMSVTHQDLLMG